MLREGRGHADDVQVQVGRRIEENVILAGRPPEKVARRDRDGRFPVTERRVARRDQVQLGLGVKMSRSPGRRDVMPDVTSCRAGDRNAKPPVASRRSSSVHLMSHVTFAAVQYLPGTFPDVPI